MITTFLGHFNTIDKQLDFIIGSTKFLPYNEKINKIAHGEYVLTPWIKHHREQLKYLGEIRNLIIHHQGEEYNYITLTSDAINDIKGLAGFITCPPTAQEYMNRKPLTCESTELLADVMKRNNSHQYNIPVIAEKKVIGGINSGKLLDRAIGQGDINFNSLYVGDIPLTPKSAYQNIKPETTIIEILHILSNQPVCHTLLIEVNGCIEGIITRNMISSIITKNL